MHVQDAVWDKQIEKMPNGGSCRRRQLCIRSLRAIGGQCCHVVQLLTAGFTRGPQMWSLWKAPFTGVSRSGGHAFPRLRTSMLAPARQLWQCTEGRLLRMFMLGIP